MADQATTIPNGWKITTLGEVLDIRNGKSRPDDGTRYPVYGGNGILGYADEYNIDEKIIIVGRVGAYCGSIFFEKEKFWLSDNALGVLAKEKSNINFLYYLLKKINLNKQAIGGAQPLLTQGVINQIEALIPEREEEQRAIAAVLSSLDNKIELLREQNKTLEAAAQAIFKEWFVNFNFPGATGKMIDSELGQIPEGWRVGGLTEDKISKFVKTNIDQFDGSKDYVETSNVNLSNFVGNFEKITFSDRPSRANMQPVKNSFWFARMAESRKYLLFQDNDDIESKILSTGFAGIQSIKEYLYFYWCFILSDIFNVLKNQYAEGAVQVAISNSGIQRIKLALPPIEIALEFTEAVGFCFEKISNNNSQIETLSKLRDTLLPKLMKGDVRVKGFEN